MRLFAESAHSCYLIEYNKNPRPFVMKLGDTKESLNDHQKFDLIICNNVVEHVADPVETLRSLTNHLKETGALLVQVPMEIWRRAPLHEVPVTHVNFFVPESLTRCFNEAGLSVSYSKLAADRHNNRYITAVHTLGKRAVGERCHSTNGACQVCAYLSPTYKDR
jgi:hypothetical protein